MCVVSINVPEEILLDLHEDKNGFAEYMKKMLALDLYKNKKVSLGYCASVAEMTKEEFVQYLGMNGVSIFSFASDSEFLEELGNVKASRESNIKTFIDKINADEKSVQENEYYLEEEVEEELAL